jgi:hypothetical protein
MFVTKKIDLIETGTELIALDTWLELEEALESSDPPPPPQAVSASINGTNAIYFLC